MVGVVIAAHGELAKEFLATTELIMGAPLTSVVGVSIDAKEPPEVIAKKIDEKIKEVDENDGVLVITDMFGGTPSNYSLSFLEEGKVEVLSGLNLPMMIGIASERKGKTLQQLAKFIRGIARDNVSLASDILSFKEDSSE